jgi:peroxiredoxin
MKKIKVLFPAILFLLLVILVFQSAFTPSELSELKVGDIAPGFTLKNVDGKMVSPEQFADAKGFIVIFTCNHCPFSVKYEDRIIELHKKYAVKGFPVIAINPNDAEKQPEDSFEEMQKRAKEKKFPFPYLYDETQEIAKAYGAMRTPHVFLLTKTDRGNEVAYIGAIDDNAHAPGKVKEKYVEQAIEAILQAKPVPQTTTKAIGCTIKWKG